MPYVLRIDVGRQTWIKEPVPRAWEDWGGRGLTAQILTAEVDPTCNALGPKNKVILAQGLVAHRLPVRVAYRLAPRAPSPGA